MRPVSLVPLPLCKLRLRASAKRAGGKDDAAAHALVRELKRGFRSQLVGQGPSDQLRAVTAACGQPDGYADPAFAPVDHQALGLVLP